MLLYIKQPQRVNTYIHLHIHICFQDDLSFAHGVHVQRTTNLYGVMVVCYYASMVLCYYGVIEV
jgi:hypothetical protein